MRIELTVNGEQQETEIWEGESLLFALRERLGLPGSKNACEQGECGSCSVLLDGTLRMRVPRSRGPGGRPSGRHRRRTRPRGGAPSRCSRPSARPARCSAASARRAWIVATARPARPQRGPERDDEIREALSGNLCRCTGYAKIFDAVRLAAER